jgi:hypothetical protein
MYCNPNWTTATTLWIVCTGTEVIITRGIGKSPMQPGEGDEYIMRMQWKLKLKKILESGYACRDQGKPWKCLGLADLGVRVLSWDEKFSLYHRVKTSSVAHPTSYLMGDRFSFPGGKVTGVWSWQLTSILCPGQECMDLYLHSSNMPPWRGAELQKAEGLLYFHLLHWTTCFQNTGEVL